MRDLLRHPFGRKLLEQLKQSEPGELDAREPQDEHAEVSSGSATQLVEFLGKSDLRSLAKALQDKRSEVYVARQARRSVVWVCHAARGALGQQ